MSCHICDECAPDRCDDCGEKICEAHMNKLGNLLFCDACLQWNAFVEAKSAQLRAERIAA